MGDQVDAEFDAMLEGETTPRMVGKDYTELFKVGGIASILLSLALFAIAGIAIGIWIEKAVSDEEDTLILEGRCIFTLMCEELIGDAYGPTAVDIYCGGAGTVMGRCGLTSDGSIDSSLLSELVGHSDASSPDSPVSSVGGAPSAWYAW